MDMNGLLPRCGPRCPAFAPVAAAGGRRQRAQVAARAGEEPAASRRCVLGSALLLGALPLAPRAAEAAEEGGEGSGRRGIARYIRRKKLDPLEEYVPAVIAARKQLQAAGSVMREDIDAAKELLRKGAFDGLRDNIRALGDYAEKGGTKDARKLVDGFFAAVQAYDYTLFQAKRVGEPVGRQSQEKLEATIAALDKLLATVPAEILEQSEKIVAAVEQYYSQPPEAAPEPAAEQQLPEQQPEAQQQQQQQPGRKPGGKLDELIQLVPGS